MGEKNLERENFFLKSKKKPACGRLSPISQIYRNRVLRGLELRVGSPADTTEARLPRAARKCPADSNPAPIGRFESNLCSGRPKDASCRTCTSPREVSLSLLLGGGGGRAQSWSAATVSPHLPLTGCPLPPDIATREDLGRHPGRTERKGTLVTSCSARAFI